MLPALPEIQLRFDVAGLPLAEAGRRRDASLLGQERGAGHRHGTGLCARLEAAPTPQGYGCRQAQRAGPGHCFPRLSQEQKSGLVCVWRETRPW